MVRQSEHTVGMILALCFLTTFISTTISDLVTEAAAETPSGFDNTSETKNKRNGAAIPASGNMVSIATAPTTQPSSQPYPKPTGNLPVSWDAMRNRVFIHGCKAEGLFNATELALAAKYPFLTVEKGQGEALPGFAEEKMAALSHQYKTARPSGWSFFYLNAKLVWGMYRVADTVAHNPQLAVYTPQGDLCRVRGDPSFPQPPKGNLVWNVSNADTRNLFVSVCVNATTPAGGDFNGCFIDSANSWPASCATGTLLASASSQDRVGVSSSSRGKSERKRSSSSNGHGAPKAVSGSEIDEGDNMENKGHGCGPRACSLDPAAEAAMYAGLKTLLRQLQSRVTTDRLIIAKDGGNSYPDAAYTNSLFMSDTFCTCYSCTWGPQSVSSCKQQIMDAMTAGARGQVVMMHGEVNHQNEDNSQAVTHDFRFSLACYLIAAHDNSLFGFSNGWYYNGTRWWPEYDKPLGVPLHEAIASQNDTVFRREFEHASVWVDLNAHNSTIHWH